MNWLKSNPVLAALAVLAVLGTAGTGFLAMEGAARKDQAVADFNSQAASIRRLQAKQPYPDSENLKKIEEGIRSYEAAITGMIDELNKMEAPSVQITPQIFQDNLRQAVDDLRKAAAEKKVGLPEKFFFGFDDYQTQLPTQDETARLNREFQVIKTLLESLVPLGITRIDSLVRNPAAKSKPEPRDPKAAPTPPGTPAAPEPIPFESFTLAFSAPQSSFANGFDKIAQSPGFLVVRSLAIENSKPEPPAKAQPDSRAAAPAARNEATLLPDQLPRVFGDELVKATILFEIPDFPVKSTANQPPPKK